MTKPNTIFLVPMIWHSSRDIAHYLVFEVIDDDISNYYMARRPIKNDEHVDQYPYYNEIYN